jgi:hypothetical protein
VPSKRYKVVGESPVLGNEPGESFSASIDKTHEEFLVGIGALEVAKDSGGSKDKKDD